MKKCWFCGIDKSSGKRIRPDKQNNGKYICQRHYDQRRRGYELTLYTIRDKNEIIKQKDYAEVVLKDVNHIETGRALISLESINLISKYKWHLGSHGYAMAYNPDEKPRKILMHRLIMKAKNDDFVDHRNQNRLDNRKENFRICTQQENSFNTSKTSLNTSGIIGVSWDTGNEKWMAYIRIDGKNKFLGRYKNKEDAIITRLKKEKEYYGEFAPQQHLFEQYNINIKI